MLLPLTTVVGGGSNGYPKAGRDVFSPPKGLAGGGGHLGAPPFKVQHPPKMGLDELSPGAKPEGPPYRHGHQAPPPQRIAAIDGSIHMYMMIALMNAGVFASLTRSAVGKPRAGVGPSPVGCGSTGAIGAISTL